MDTDALDATEDTEPVDALDTAACPQGAPCDDGDPCTVNDQCTGGVCAGNPVACNDDLPCTQDACDGGVCTHAVAPGFCLIAGTCWTEAQKNPAAPCQRCATPLSRTTWSNADGAACDDGDPCTSLDACGGGLCSGTPLTCEDDGNPCTQAVCEAGGCVHKATAGTCDDGDPCTGPDVCDKGTCTPGPVVDGDGDQATPTGCPGGTDCDDGDGAVHPGAPEVCDDGKDNDCNGQTDAEDAACAVDVTCDYHTDCYPERVCAVWITTGSRRCSDPCAGPSDCASGQICSKLPGSAQVGFCQDAPEKKAVGAQCADSSECSTDLCSDGFCTHLCLDQAHCAGAGFVCHPVGDLQIGEIGAACAPGPPGLLGLGQVCSKDGVTYAGFVCQSGHCDVLSASSPCASVCTSESDCAPQQECNVVLYAPGTTAAVVPYDPQFTTPTHDAATACYTPPGAGQKADGMPCAVASDCRSHKCMPLLPANPATFCTSFCTGDAECPADMRCKLEATNLASAWLQDPFNGSQAPAPGAWTLVRICKFP